MTDHGNKTDYSQPKRTALHFDAAEFVHFLSDTDWSDEEKAEYVTLIWNIVCEFVALGFDVHPVNHARNSCGKLPNTQADPVLAGADMVECSHSHLIEEFMRLNGSKPDSGGQGVIDE